jgi:cystathionine beta-lyase family protein involved in aluminum resistance
MQGFEPWLQQKKGCIEKDIVNIVSELEDISLHNHIKVLQAFKENRVSDYHFHGTTGYGYSDSGRETLERVFANVFGAEKALVRSQIVSGTHAIALALFGVLRPGDELICAAGAPYDTLEEVIGIRGRDSGSLREWGITYKEVPLTEQGSVNLEALRQAISPKTRMISIQRSRGYSLRPPLSIESIRNIIAAIRKINANIVCFVDNCYGEFVERLEPTEVGADLLAGSLIKNPGGGLAPMGGYLVGKGHLIDLAACRLTAPGIGGTVGSSPSGHRLLYQGLYMAPHIVAEALKGAVFAAKLFSDLGFCTTPHFDEKRSDIIQALKLDSEERMVAFCRGLQRFSPVDAHVIPEPSSMPGYSDRVVMAGGTFIQGATIELGADGPLRPPYVMYMQGGLSQIYVKLGVLGAVQEMHRLGLLSE